jgi:drug/metabolite transporter (DMT)-like permease
MRLRHHTSNAVVSGIALLDVKSAASVFGAAFITITLFALTPITTRFVVAHVDAMTVGLSRTVLAVPVAAAILFAFRLRPPAGFRQWRLLAVSAGGGFVGFPILFSLGAQRTSAAHACLCMAAIPLFTALTGMLVEGKRPRLGWILGAGIAMFGEASLVSIRDPLLSQPYSVTGDGLVLASAVSVACSFVAGSRLTAQTDSWSATFWSVALAGAMLSPWFVVRAAAVNWPDLTLLDWAALAHLSIGASVIGWVAWFYALARGGVARVAALQFLQPVLSLIFAASMLAESITPLVTLVAGTILVGLALARKYAQEPAQRGYSKRWTPAAARLRLWSMRNQGWLLSRPVRRP